MLKILESYSKPLETKEATPQHAVKDWLEKSDEFESKKLKVPYNTPAQPREGYVPPVQTGRDEFRDQPKTAPSNVQNTIERNECSLTRGQSDASLFSKVLQENRLPKPKMMTFDGDPKDTNFSWPVSATTLKHYLKVMIN